MNETTMNDLPTLIEEDEHTKSHHLSDCKELDETDKRNDGVILKKEENNEFSALPQLSPILKDTTIKETFERTTTKRLRVEEDMMDNVSFDSTSISLSSKKPKLMRTASLTKNLRKSLSFGIMKTPINNMFRSRRNSVDHDISASASMISMESTFNETITKPLKEKFRRIRDKASKMMKRDHDTPKASRKDRSFHFGTENLNESKSSYFMNMSLSGNILKTPEKGQMSEPKTPRFFSEFQIPKSADLQSIKQKQFDKEKNFMLDTTDKNMVI